MGILGNSSSCVNWAHGERYSYAVACVVVRKLQGCFKYESTKSEGVKRESCMIVVKVKDGLVQNGRIYFILLLGFINLAIV